MTALPDIVKQAWEDREGFPVFTTADAEGLPNAIYVGAVGIYDDHTMVIANNFFYKTKANLLAGSKAALVFITRERKAYQIKGSIRYVTDGPYFEFLDKINPKDKPGHGAAVFKVEAVYHGADKLTE